MNNYKYLKNYVEEITKIRLRISKFEKLSSRLKEVAQGIKDVFMIDKLPRLTELENVVKKYIKGINIDIRKEAGLDGDIRGFPGLNDLKVIKKYILSPVHGPTYYIKHLKKVLNQSRKIKIDKKDDIIYVKNADNITLYMAEDSKVYETLTDREQVAAVLFQLVKWKDLDTVKIIQEHERILNIVGVLVPIPIIHDMVMFSFMVYFSSTSRSYIKSADKLVSELGYGKDWASVLNKLNLSVVENYGWLRYIGDYFQNYMERLGNIPILKTILNKINPVSTTVSRIKELVGVKNWNTVEEILNDYQKDLITTYYKKVGK